MILGVCSKALRQATITAYLVGGLNNTSNCDALVPDLCVMCVYYACMCVCVKERCKHVDVGRVLVAVINGLALCVWL